MVVTREERAFKETLRSKFWEHFFDKEYPWVTEASDTASGGRSVTTYGGDIEDTPADRELARGEMVRMRSKDYVAPIESNEDAFRAAGLDAPLG